MKGLVKILQEESVKQHNTLFYEMPHLIEAAVRAADNDAEGAKFLILVLGYEVMDCVIISREIRAGRNLCDASLKVTISKQPKTD